jgi:hypothetical protein
MSVDALRPFAARSRVVPASLTIERTFGRMRRKAEKELA